VRRGRVAALVAAVAMLLVIPPQAGALARNTAPHGPRPLSALKPLNVQELDFVFIPDPAKAQLGQTVQWGNTVHNVHTTTGAAPLSLWDSGVMNFGNKFAFTFTAAGVYPYLCTLHEGLNMVSSVGVRDTVDPPSGPVGTVFTVTLATIPAPADYVYDAQKREPGGPWRDWMTGITSTSVPFDSTGKLPGTYQFRSRLHRVSDDASTNYSPPASITVTP